MDLRLLGTSDALAALVAALPDDVRVVGDGPADVALARDPAVLAGADARVRVRWVEEARDAVTGPPLPALAASRWVAGLLADLWPGVPVEVVRPGRRAAAPQSTPSGVLVDRTRALTTHHVAAAMAEGAVPVVTSAPGIEELVEHGVSGLVVAWDDDRGTETTLDLLRRDDALRARLRDGAKAAGAAWPSAEDAGRRLAQALRDLAG